MKPINVGLLGIGTVGGGAWTVLRRNQEEIGRRAGCDIAMKMVADKDIDKVRAIVGERLDEAPTGIVAAPSLPTGTAYVSSRTDVDTYRLGTCSGTVTTAVKSNARSSARCSSSRAIPRRISSVTAAW